MKTIDDRSEMEIFYIKPIKLSIHTTILESLKGVGSKVNPYNPLSLSVLSVTRASHVTRDTCPACAGEARVISDTASRHEERHCSHGPIRLQPSRGLVLDH